MSPLPGARQPARITNIAIPPDQSSGADMPAPTKPQKIGGPKLKKKSNGSAIFGISMLSRSRPCSMVSRMFQEQSHHSLTLLIPQAWHEARCMTDGQDARPEAFRERRGGGSPGTGTKKPTPGRPGIGLEAAPQSSAYCGFTNRPTRPAAPLVWPLSLACSSGRVSLGGSSFGSRSVAITI